MLARLFLSAAALSALVGCGGIGSGNFSLGSNSELVALHPPEGYAEDREYRETIAQVTNLRIEQTPSGVIIHAEGLPPRQGYWDAELVAENNGVPEDGVVTYTFRIAPSAIGTRTGTPYSREVHVAAFMSNVALNGVSQIRVQGANNSRVARR